MNTHSKNEGQIGDGVDEDLGSIGDNRSSPVRRYVPRTSSFSSMGEVNIDVFDF